MTERDDRLAVEKAEPKPSESVPDEDQLKTERAYREQNDDEVDEALDESFPASDPPSYSQGPSKTG